MSRIKTYYQTEFLKKREQIVGALDRIESEMNFENVSRELAYCNKASRAVLGEIVASFSELVKEDPNYFLTCDDHNLREFANTIIKDDRVCDV